MRKNRLSNKTRKANRVFVAGTTVGSISKIFNLNTVELYFHGLRVLIHNNSRKALVLRAK